MNIENKHILFVTDEFYPINNGGIARLLNITATELTSKKCFVTILISTEDYNSVMNFKNSNSNKYLKVYGVNELLGTSSYDVKFPPWVLSLDRMHQSYRATLAIRELCNDNKFDLIEFNDCWGLGYVFFKWRELFAESFTRIPAWVRIHGTMENCMIADCISTDVAFFPYHYGVFQMERESFKMCDGIISPSKAVGEWYKQTYDIGMKPTVVSVPIFEKLNKHLIHPRRIINTPFKILYYGRVQHLKGVDNIVKAVVSIYAKHKLIIEVTLIGTVVNNYDQYLQQFIPEALKGNFKFIGLINPTELSTFAIDSDVAIVSSRLETFCLAAHELNWLGIPLILNKIAAFTDFFVDGENCLFYDNTVGSLENSILKFFSENKTGLKNNAFEVGLKPNSQDTYFSILKNSSRIEVEGTHPLYSLDDYLGAFYSIVFSQSKNLNSSVKKLDIRTTEKRQIALPFNNSHYKSASIDELNILILLTLFKVDGFDLNRGNQKEVQSIKEWYNNEYEVLPIWYKRLGHVIKVMIGKRSFKSLLKK